MEEINSTKKLIERSNFDERDNLAIPRNLCDKSRQQSKSKGRHQPESITQPSNNPYAPEGAVSFFIKIQTRKGGHRFEKIVTNT